MASGRTAIRAISLKLPDELLKSTDRYARALGVSRAEFIRRAIERMNCEMAVRLKAERMAEASRRVSKESMKINAEFS